MSAYRVGSVVRVGPAYRGHGLYLPDGTEGVYTVVRFLAPADYKLCSGVYDQTPDASEWDLICHESRIVPVQS